MPSDTYLQPQYADQFTGGIYKTFGGDLFEMSMEAYYKKFYHIIDFRDNAELFLNDKVEMQILPGEAKSYGLELMLKKNKGIVNGWISYTFSKSLRRINGINNNEWYPPVYDHRHNLSVVFNRPLTKRLSMAANWIYRSGGHTTIPEGSYVFGDSRLLYFSSRNGYTLPAYHRLDLDITLSPKEKNKQKRFQGEWVLSFYNVYNRKNVFSLYITQDSYYGVTALARKVYLAGIIPSLTYNFKF